MTPQQIQLVQDTWDKVLPIQNTAAGLFYERLFELDRSLRPLFKGDLHVQRRRLMIMIDTAVKGLDDFDNLIPALRVLGQRHAGYGVRDEHYGVVGMALLWTLQQGLGTHFTAEAKAAWTETYRAIARTMQGA